MSILKFFSRLKERPEHLKGLPEYICPPPPPPKKQYIRPPLGIVPMYLWIEQRIDDLNDAIISYENAGLLPKKEWKDEIIYLSDMQCRR